MPDEVLGTAVLQLTYDDSRLIRGLADAQRATERAGDAAAKAFDSKLTDRQKAAWEDLNRNITRWSMAATAAFGAVGVLAAKSAIDFESSFAGIRKTVDATESQFSALASGMRAMAKEIPVNVNELNRIGEAAGQLGIKTENILGFTRVMADLGVATNLTSDQAATALARLANITGMAQTDFDRLGSTIVALGNNFATTESEIVEMSLRIAGAGHQVGLTEPQIMALATALSSVGIEADAGGSAISRVMMQIALQVETSGDKLGDFAAVAGQTVEDFSRAWREDAVGALMAFIQGLSNTQETGKSAIAVLDDLGLTEIRVRDALLRSSAASDLLSNAVNIANTAWQDNNALTNEASQRYSTTASQITIAKNNMQDVAISLGQQLTPAIKTASEGMVKFADVLSAMPQSTINIALGFGAITAALPLVVSAAAKLVNMWNTLRTSADTAAAAQARLKLGLTGIGIALTAVAVGADMILQKTSGHGLFEWIFGDPAKADRQKQLLKDFEATLYAMGPNADRTGEALARLKDSVGNVTDAYEALANRDKLHDLKLERDFDRAKESLDVFVKTARESQVPFEELFDIYKSLPAGLQDVFAKSFGSMQEWNAAVDAMMQQHALAADEYLKQIYLQSQATESVVKTLPGLASQVDTVKNAFAEWGAVATMVYQKLDTEGQEKLYNLAQSMNGAGLTTKQFSELIETEIGEDAADAFNKLLETAQESLDDIVEAIQGVLPSVDETFEKWKKRIDQMVEDQLNFKTNLTTIYTALKDAGVEMAEEITAAIAREGPAYAASFTKFYGEHPQEVLEELKAAAPVLVGETNDAIAAEVMGFAPNMDLATQIAWGDPWRKQMAETKAANEKAARETAQALELGFEREMATFPATLQKNVGKPIENEGKESAKAADTAGRSIGSALAAGIAAGLNAEELNLMRTAITLRDKVIAQFQQIFGIHSPSTVMAEEVGRPLVQGVAAGIAAGEADVVAATVKAIDTSTMAALQAIDINTGLIKDEYRDAIYGIGDVAIPAAAAVGTATGQAMAAGMAAGLASLGGAVNGPLGIGAGGGGGIVNAAGQSPGEARVGANGDIPGIQGYDVVFDTFTGKWKYVPHAYEGTAPGVPIEVSKGVFMPGDSYANHPGQYWDGTAWRSLNVNNPISNPTYEQASTAPGGGHIDINTGQWVPNTAPSVASAMPSARDVNAGTGGGNVSFNANITIEGNADGDDLRRALDEWWEATKDHEFGYGAQLAGARG